MKGTCCNLDGIFCQNTAKLCQGPRYTKKHPKLSAAPLMPLIFCWLNGYSSFRGEKKVKALPLYEGYLVSDNFYR